MNTTDNLYDGLANLSDTPENSELMSEIYSLLLSGKNTFAFNRKIMEKSIDISWVEAIEKGLPHLDKVVRNPSKTIEDVETVVPIALSKKITVESVKHLAQHTDLIQEIDKKTGKITPSKILNVHKEETLMTYENKFINTLVDRLYIFLNVRYQKLAQVAHDEEAFTLDYDADLDNNAGKRMKVSIKLEAINSLEATNAHGLTVWDRVEKIKKAIEGYKGSTLCTTLGNTMIRPPVMRTNAIMKNVDLKACLTLWQYIEGYDKVGYEINVLNSAQKPSESYVYDVYKLAALNLALLRSYAQLDKNGSKDLKTQNVKTVAPKFLRRFEKETADKYSFTSETANETAKQPVETAATAVELDIGAELDNIISTEVQYIKDERERQEEIERRRREAEQARLERERIEREMEEERERQRKEKEEQDRRAAEMLAKAKAEQEAREREERERLEAERKLAEEERQKREEEERIQAKRERIREDKKFIAKELATASSSASQPIEESTVEISEAPEFEEIESPEVAARKAKEKQQQLERERVERERADKLRADRARIESKEFSEVYREYCKRPIQVIRRGMRDSMAKWFGIIPKDTDNPEYLRVLAEQQAKKQAEEEKKKIDTEMEVLYEKYAPNFKYRRKRNKKYRKFKRRRREELKNKPRPEYHPIERTPEEQKEYDRQIKLLYKEYHIGKLARAVRSIKEKYSDDEPEDKAS